jgi:hypothetical protein
MKKAFFICLMMLIGAIFYHVFIADHPRTIHIAEQAYWEGITLFTLWAFGCIKES